jgi:hypothetical protein
MKKRKKSPGIRIPAQDTFIAKKIPIIYYLKEETIRRKKSCKKLTSSIINNMPLSSLKPLKRITSPTLSLLKDLIAH